MNNLEKFAQIFEVEIQDLFAFQHQRARETVIDDLHNLLNKAPDDKLKLIYRLVSDVLKEFH